MSATVDVTQRFAVTLVDELAARGLREVVVAPGSRSAPLAMAVAREPRLRTLIQVDERCAGFFALGLARETGRPVAVICTSGTAAAQLHAAVIEAHHARLPLLLLTADRPPELRDAGAPQTIDQVGLYGSTTRWSFDPGPPVDAPDAPRTWRRLASRALAMAGGDGGAPPGPVHLNLPFREPLVPPPGVVARAEGGRAGSVETFQARSAPAAGAVDRLAGALQAARRPLIVAGGLQEHDVGSPSLLSALDALTAATGAVVLAEPTSQLRRPDLAGLVTSYDALLRDPAFADTHRPDLVLRIGAPPTSKALNQHLAAASPATSVLIDPHGWRDPEALATQIVRADPSATIAALAGALTPTPPSPDVAMAPADHPGWRESWLRADVLARAAIDATLAGLPLFEAHAVHALARSLPENARVVVGSSMPIRDVDTFWPASTARLLANRGANGIDGFVSTAMGVAAAGADPVAAICGDLTLYHDMNGLWSARRHGLHPVILVLDNDGGGIFSFLPQAEHPDVFEEVFATPLGLDLASVAKLHDLDHHPVDRDADLEPALRQAFATGRPALVHVRFTRPDSVTGHRACWQAVAAALRG